MVGDREASQVDLGNQAGLSLALSEADPEASLRTNNSYMQEVIPENTSR